MFGTCLEHGNALPVSRAVVESHRGLQVETDLVQRGRLVDEPVCFAAHVFDCNLRHCEVRLLDVPQQGFGHLAEASCQLPAHVTDQWQENENADEIYCAVKSHQREQRVAEIDDLGNEMEYRVQEYESDDIGDDIENDDGDRHALLVVRTRKRTEHGGDCRAEVGTDRGGGGRRQGNDTGVQRAQRDHDRGGTRLDDRRDHQADQEKHDRRVGRESFRVEQRGRADRAPFHEFETHQHQAETGKQMTEAGTPCSSRGTPDHTQAADGHERQRRRLDIEFETDGCDDPAGRGRAEIRAEDDTERTRQRNDSGADERQHNEAHDGTRLQRGRRDDSGKHALYGMCRMFAQEFLERASGE